MTHGRRKARHPGKGGLTRSQAGYMSADDGGRGTAEDSLERLAAELHAERAGRLRGRMEQAGPDQDRPAN